MSRRLLIAALAAPLVGAAIAYGCSDEPAIESLCDWISDPGNCYRYFREDMEADGGIDCKPLGNPTPVQPGVALGTTNGAFLNRAMLDTCILDQGGSITLSPAIDLTMIPPSVYSQPITYTLTFNSLTGNVCGMATYTSPHGFSFTINAPPDAGGGLLDSTDGGGGAGGGATTVAVDAGFVDAGIHYPYGTYTEVNPPGRDTIDTTCPSGEAHHFVLDETSGPPGLDGGAVSACPGFKDLVPEAFFQIDPGGVGINGGVSFSIVWPPINRTYPANLDPAEAPYVAPNVVTYFNCSIPSAPPTCLNGVMDGSETDVDCGGPITDLNCACPVRCQTMQHCLCDTDCAQPAICGVNPMDGTRVCTSATDAGVGRNCPYELIDAGPPAASCGFGTGGGAGVGGGATGTGGAVGAGGTGGV